MGRPRVLGASGGLGFGKLLGWIEGLGIRMKTLSNSMAWTAIGWHRFGLAWPLFGTGGLCDFKVVGSSAILNLQLLRRFEMENDSILLKIQGTVNSNG